MFEPLYTAAEMRAAEERYPGYPASVPELMERAGAAVAREAMLAYPAARRFACVCGGGSNGGDGRVAARVLREAGHVADEAAEPDGYDVVIDALFGTGFHGEPRPEAAELIARINRAAAPVVAVDLPSGVDASTGEVAAVAVEADLTVTFHALKVGHVVAPGRFHAGTVVVVDIGLDELPTEGRRATRELLGLVPRRVEGDTKYSAGSVLVVGGQPGMTSAACLTALAAMRADAGYVTLAVPEESLAAAEAIALEPVKIGWSAVQRCWRPSLLLPSVPARSRSAPASGGERAARSSSAPCSKTSRCRQSSTRTACTRCTRCSGRRRSCSRRTRASWRVSSTATRGGWTRTASKQSEPPPTASGPSSCSRGRTPSSLHPPRA